MAGAVVKTLDNGLEKTGAYATAGKFAGYYFFRHTKREDAKTSVGKLIDYASPLIRDCPPGQELRRVPLRWLREVKELIHRWESIDNAPGEWTKLTDWKNLSSVMSWDSSTVQGQIGNWPHQIGRISAKISTDADKLIQRYNDEVQKRIDDNTVYIPLPRPQHQSFTAWVFECRLETVDMVISSICDDRFRVTQIFGPGGIGKTTMLHDIQSIIDGNSRLVSTVARNKFEKVVYVEVSRWPDICKIQDTIVTQLGLSKLDVDGRARELKQKIETVGQVLVILDDVWTSLNMDEIWTQSENVRVLVATRMRHLRWNDEKKIPVDPLSDEDSWLLFKQAAAICDDHSLVQTAKQVKSECYGLPLALAVIGKSLSGKGEDDWKRAARYLQNSRQIEERSVQEQLYNIIKYSYEELLPHENSKKMFLCCSLFPDKEKVNELDLKRYLIGEDVERFAKWEERVNLNRSLDTLVSYGLMERNSETGILKMHDVIRDVAVYIASDERFALIHCGMANVETMLEKNTFRTFRRISVMKSCIEEATGKPSCPNLQTLLIRSNEKLGFLPDNFFQKMEVLAVLDLSYSEISSLPGSMKRLKKLRTLLLNGCSNLHDIEVIVNLKGLRVLSLRESAVKSLPKAMSNLVELIVLDLSTVSAEDNKQQGRVDFIESLPRLQELCMAIKSITEDIFIKIAKMKRLRAVKLYVGNSVLSSNAITKIDRLSNWLSFTIYNNLDLDCPLKPQGKNMCIERLLPIKENSVSPVKLLLQETENVFLKECFKPIPQRAGEKYLTAATGGSKFEKTKILHLTECDSLEYLCPQNCSTLEELEEIQLKSLKELIGIFEDTVSEKSFGQVRVVTIISCAKIEYVIPDNVLQKVHAELQKITVRDCAKVKSIFHPEAPYQKCLPVLTLIQLEDLESLQSIWQGTLHSGTFKNLTEIIVRRCHGLKSLFTAHLAAMLTNLQKLTVENNNELIEIVSSDGNVISPLEEAFPRVSHLSLQHMKKLKHFIPNDDDTAVNLKWPLLVQLKLRDCDALTRFPMNIATSAPHMTRVNDKPWPRSLPLTGKGF